MDKQTLEYRTVHMSEQLDKIAPALATAQAQIVSVAQDASGFHKNK